MMKKQLAILGMALASGLWTGNCAAYNSGSTGVDGAFNPTTSQSVALPPDGIFNYTSVNIPAGVTITYTRNAANTPVTILATGDVTIAGTINVSGSGNPNPADIAGAGVGGPGGYNGGRGGPQAGITANWVNGYAGLNVGRAGVGPGGGSPGMVRIPSAYFGAGYAELSGGGPGAYSTVPQISSTYCPVAPGATYGNTTLMPLVGGSGGGGGAGGAMTPGSGGAGGGGAILIAASGILNVTGAILANGGNPSAPSAADGHGSTGGAGSGGAIRLIASTVSGNGTISAVGGGSGGDGFSSSVYGNYGGCSYYYSPGLTGGLGRIRIEYDTLLRTTPTNPAWLGGAPGLTFVPSLPSLRIDSIVTNLGSITVPLNPTGNGDIVIPAGFTNPVTANFVTTGVTVGSTIVLTVMPASGPAYNTANTAITTGTISNATGSIVFNLPPGSITVQAKVTYTVVASIGDAMSVYAMGERVEKVTLASTLGGKESQVTLTTVSGKEYSAPVSVLALAKLRS